MVSPCSLINLLVERFKRIRVLCIKTNFLFSVWMVVNLFPQQLQRGWLDYSRCIQRLSFPLFLISVILPITLRWISLNFRNHLIDLTVGLDDLSVDLMLCLSCLLFLLPCQLFFHIRRHVGMAIILVASLFLFSPSFFDLSSSRTASSSFEQLQFHFGELGRNNLTGG